MSVKSKKLAKIDEQKIASVEEQIARGNPWYVGDQLEWANLPYIKPIYDKRKHFLLSAIEDLKIQKDEIFFLDCGCGDGYWTSLVSHIMGLKVIGMDFNDLWLNRARTNAPNAEFFKGDVLSLKTIFSHKFDLIWCSQVIEHIEDDAGTLRQLHRMIADDGVLILGTTNEGSLLYKINQFFTNYRKDSDHVHFYTRKEITNKIIDAGFKIERTLYEPFFPLSEKLFYRLMSQRISRYVLTLMAQLFPSGCTDYYFRCKKH